MNTQRRTEKQEAGREEIKGTFLLEAIRESSDGNQRVDTGLREVLLSQRYESGAEGEGHRVSAAGCSNVTNTQLNTHKLCLSVDSLQERTEHWQLPTSFT